MAFIEQQIRERSVAGTTPHDHPQLAAELFMSMTLGGPARVRVSGGQISDAEVEQRITLTVRVFLEGVRRKLH